jgi:hypothetical protein
MMRTYIIYIYPLTECEVHTVSYGPGFFHCFMAQARNARAIKKVGKNEYP